MNNLYLKLKGQGDWSDRLNPVLVKEIRQGLRTHLFAWSLIILQATLSLFSLVELPAQGDALAQATLQVYFWLWVGVLLIIVIPVRAVGMIQQEHKNNTLEAISLTRLSAFKIVYGKWLALALQALLLTTTLLPHLMIAYLLGGHELIHDAIWLVSLLLACFPLIALGICISATKHFAPRVVMAVIFLVFSFIFFSCTLSLVGMIVWVITHGLGYTFPQVIDIWIPVVIITFILLTISAAYLILIMLNVAITNAESVFSRYELHPGISNRLPSSHA